MPFRGWRKIPPTDFHQIRYTGGEGHARANAVYLKGLAQILFELFTKNHPPGAQDFTTFFISILKSRFRQPRPNGSLDIVLISHTGVEIDEDDRNSNAKKIQ